MDVLKFKELETEGKLEAASLIVESYSYDTFYELQNSTYGIICASSQLFSDYFEEYIESKYRLKGFPESQFLSRYKAYNELERTFKISKDLIEENLNDKVCYYDETPIISLNHIIKFLSNEVMNDVVTEYVDKNFLGDIDNILFRPDGVPLTSDGRARYFNFVKIQSVIKHFNIDEIFKYYFSNFSYPEYHYLNDNYRREVYVFIDDVLKILNDENTELSADENNLICDRLVEYSKTVSKKMEISHLVNMLREVLTKQQPTK